MTALDAVEEANEEADIKTFRFANIAEFNSFLDSFDFSDWPINVIVPFDDNGTWIGGRRKSVIPLQGWVLTRIDTDTVNIRSAEAERHFLNPMRILAKKFIKAVINSDITDPEVENITDSIKPAYAFLSVHAFGVSYTMNWPVTETIC